MLSLLERVELFTSWELRWMIEILSEFDNLFTNKAINCFKSGFLNLSPVDILNWVILCGGGCLVLCRKFKSIHGLYPLDASNACLQRWHLQCLWCCQMCAKGPNQPWLRTTALSRKENRHLKTGACSEKGLFLKKFTSHPLIHSLISCLSFFFLTAAVF